MNTKNVLIDFLQYSLGTREVAPAIPDEQSWQELYQQAKAQTLVGVLFDGISRLQQVPKPILFKWLNETELIRRSNMHVNRTAVKVFDILRKDHIECCILKGQGNTLMYPNPYSRTPGDIDIWLNASRKEIEKYVCAKFPIREKIILQHASTQIDGVEVELHFFPNMCTNPVYNHRWQKWFHAQAVEQCKHIVSLPDEAGNIAIPTSAFNVIYQLCHMQHHFFDEGLGLRQVVDYFYVLKSFYQETEENFYQEKKEAQQNLQQEAEEAKKNLRQQTERLLRHLGLQKFAGAIMYLQHHILGLPEEYLIAPIDEERGKLVLSEILNGGNFGRSDTKYGNLTQQKMAHKFFTKTWRVSHFARLFPEESLCEPFFRVYHFGWRLWNNHIKKLL